MMSVISCDRPERGCTSVGAANFDHEAEVNDGSCVWQRTFWSEYKDTTENAWIDVWVAGSDTSTSKLRYEGRISEFYSSSIPGCTGEPGLVEVLRKPGEYFYEVENNKGEVFHGWVIFRNDDICRLSLVKYTE